ncbi:MAG: FecR domain-containing protein [Prolixibacteraceae bacterium]|nr:FecR domain-containing protein [Prolixibacteraceae bacterium]
MEDSINDSLLYKFLLKETSDAENREILGWVSASEENRAEFRRIHKLFFLSNNQQFQAKLDIDQAWEMVNSKLPHTTRNSKVVSMNFFLKAAASVLVLLTVGIGSLWSWDRFFANRQSAMVTFETPKGEKSRIILADGSLVWLNSETILKYDALHPRNVSVTGEAYFDVKKDKEHPFEVSTASGMKVKVTGTRFNLKTYLDEPGVETTLEEGEVTVENADDSNFAVLKPGQQALYDIQKDQLTVRNVSPEIYSIWKNNELHIINVPFTDLIPRIERWYGVSIHLDSLINRNDRFTMTIKTESLRELLNMMQLTSKFKYEVNGGQIKIHAK